MIGYKSHIYFTTRVANNIKILKTKTKNVVKKINYRSNVLRIVNVICLKKIEKKLL